METTTWILGNNNQPGLMVEDGIRLRLLCFPQAGSGAWVYQEWEKMCPKGVQVLPIELPGKNTRRRERCMTSMTELVNAAVDALRPVFQSKVPFAIFGHSMGSWIAYAVTQELQARQWNLPVKLYVSGVRSPTMTGVEYDPDGVEMHKLEIDEFWEAFERRYGHNRDLEDDAVKRFVYPTLKSDFQISETYRRSSEDLLPCPLSVSGGTEDVRINKANVEAWIHCADPSEVSFHWFPGGHNYLFKEEESKSSFMEYLCLDLENVLSGNKEPPTEKDEKIDARVQRSPVSEKEPEVRESASTLSTGGSSIEEKMSHNISEAGATVASSGSYALHGPNPALSTPRTTQQMSRNDVVRKTTETSVSIDSPSSNHSSTKARNAEKQKKTFFDCLFCR